MGTLATPDHVRRAKDNAGYLSKRVEEQLSDIFPESPPSAEPDHPEVAAWFYRVPCPGVRYYSYEESCEEVFNRPERGRQGGPQSPSGFFARGGPV